MKGQYTDSQRMALRSHVKLASEVLGTYWPMRMFVHHNPLHELESSEFVEAVARVERLLDARGYLPNEQYRRYVREGRIHPEDLDRALRAVARAEQVRIGDRTVGHLEVLRAHLLEGITPPADEQLEMLMEREGDGHIVQPLIERLRGVLTIPEPEARTQQVVREDLSALGRTLTLSAWCDRTLGTGLVGWLDGELTRWSAAFLDEGHAAWPMPFRERSLYGGWKTLAHVDRKPFFQGLRRWAERVADLPPRPEDALLDALAALAIPDALHADYLTLHLATLPGWAAFIKWRGEQSGYPWQTAFPADLVKFLAMRLVYEQHLVAQACAEELDRPGTFEAVRRYMETHPAAYVLRVRRTGGRLPLEWARRVDRLRHRPADPAAWDALAGRYLDESAEADRRAALRAGAWRLLRLADALSLPRAALLDASPASLVAVLGWLEAFPEDRHGPVWLEAFEAGHHRPFLAQLGTAAAEAARTGEAAGPEAVRPQAQAVFCIDVRSEPLRRHLESLGNYGTFGFAGFFICFIRYRALGSHHETDQYPVIGKARNLVREIPRSYHGDVLSRHRAGTRFFRGVHTLLHDLKEHVITPYVMVESLGWAYALPFFGKTLLPGWWRRLAEAFRRLVAPPVATTLTVDKLTKQEADEMVASEQRAAIRRALRERFGLQGASLTGELVEALRRRALSDEEPEGLPTTALARLPGDTPEALSAFVGELRTRYRIDRRWASAHKEHITRTGFTLEEQAFTVETALRMMGLTANFARLVLFCAHGSTSENNPFEAALDCGACGGNEGKPNARLLAAMANKPAVRERLAKNGLSIPPDTHFLAGQIDTTRDEVQLLDLEDVPPTHRKDLARLLEDIREAGRLTSQERCRRLPDVAAPLPPSRAARETRRRSADWSQVRPEWGLSGNASFIIGRRELTRTLDLGGRAFLHSYDYREDQTGRLLEVLMTAPQVVAQWISMEHYFSTVDQEVFGSGSKIYHNVVGRVGIMAGPESDLRTGLAWQTVMSGDRPYHEPMRLLTVIEAPRSRITHLIRRHELLQEFYHHGWVHLVALEPADSRLYRYLPQGEWREVVHQEEGRR